MTFGFMGRITSHTKGLDILLEAWARFINHNEGLARLIIMGDGEDLERLKETCKNKQLQSSVIFTGPKFGSEKAVLLKQIDVFLHPSRNEGMPGAPLEAATLGIPLIISKETNLSAYVSKYCNGIALNLSNAMHKLLLKFKNGSIREMGNQSKEMISNEFEWEIIAEKFNTIYSA
jgi:glycosyltransferase involved in cell wall biosynthesis